LTTLIKDFLSENASFQLPLFFMCAVFGGQKTEFSTRVKSSVLRWQLEGCDKVQ